MSYLESLRSAPPARQFMLIAAVFVVLCAAGAAVYFGVLRTPYGVLFSNLRTADAATIVEDLDKRKVAYQLRDGGATILVPAGAVDATRLAVMSEDLPLKGQVGFELFNKSDMGLTEFAQRINYQRALQGELARTIMSLDSVDTARVHLSLAEESVFRDDRRPAKASATLVARPGREVTPATVAGVQHLIAAAVPDLDPANVVVLDQHGAVMGGDTAAAAPVAADFTPVAPPAVPYTPAPPLPAMSAHPGSPFASASTFWTLGSIVILAPLVFLAGLLARRGWPVRLSDRERASHVEGFRSLLEEGGARAGRRP